MTNPQQKPEDFWEQALHLFSFNWADTQEGWQYWREEYNRLVSLAGREDELI